MATFRRLISDFAESGQNGAPGRTPMRPVGVKPLRFLSPRAHLHRCREIDPSFGIGAAAFFDGERGSEYAAGATATTQSWRLRFARAVALTATPIRVGARHRAPEPYR